MCGSNTYEDGTDSAFRNDDTQNSDAEESPKRKNTKNQIMFLRNFHYSKSAVIILTAVTDSNYTRLLTVAFHTE